MSKEANNASKNMDIEKASGDGVDANGNGTDSPTEKRVAKMPVERNARYYNMKHKHRGMAIIFNHENFYKNFCNPRPGTNVDRDTLKDELTRLAFKVTVLNDKKYEEIFSYLEDIANLDHSNFDCLVIAVLTHGDPGVLYAYNTHYKSEKIWSLFTADKCPTLAGKPKIFFIQACQGGQFDDGITLRHAETDGPVLASYKIPVHADFLIAFSTVPGYYSWRNRNRGSWFVQALCEELREYGSNTDILTLLTFVLQKVALDYESDTDDEESHEKKQIPCINSMLTRLLVFGDKK